MKRDMDLIRKILFRIESDEDINVDCPEKKLVSHILLLTEQGFIRGVVVQEALTDPPQIQATMGYVRLTAAGHDFLDTIRDDTVWEKTQAKVLTIGGGVALSVVAGIATEFLKQKLGMK